MLRVRVVRRCAHIQQVLEVQPNLDVSLVLGRLLGVEACPLLDVRHSHGQRLGAGASEEERRHREGKHAHRRVAVETVLVDGSFKSCCRILVGRYRELRPTA